jgi:hypothetical protein
MVPTTSTLPLGDCNSASAGSAACAPPLGAVIAARLGQRQLQQGDAVVALRAVAVHARVVHHGRLGRRHPAPQAKYPEERMTVTSKKVSCLMLRLPVDLIKLPK